MQLRSRVNAQQKYPHGLLANGYFANCWQVHTRYWRPLILTKAGTEKKYICHSKPVYEIQLLLLADQSQSPLNCATLEIIYCLRKAVNLVATDRHRPDPDLLDWMSFHLQLDIRKFFD